METEERIIKILLKALEKARGHLEYCDYGDKWENECATASKLPQKIDKAIAIASKWFKDYAGEKQL